MAENNFYLFPEKQDNLFLGAILAQQQRKSATEDDYERHLRRFLSLHMKADNEFFLLVPAVATSVRIVSMQGLLHSPDRWDSHERLTRARDFAHEITQKQEKESGWAADLFVLELDNAILDSEEISDLFRNRMKKSDALSL